MPKSKKDPIRENRISDEVIVDAYGPEEQVMGWYYYFDSRIHFPFTAKCAAAKTTSPLRKGETVEVRRMAPEDVCSSDMLVLVRRGKVAIWLFPCLKSPRLTLTNQRPKPSAIGIIGWLKAIRSDPSLPFMQLCRKHTTNAMTMAAGARKKNRREKSGNESD